MSIANEFDEVFFKLSRLMKTEMAFESDLAKLSMQQIHALFFLDIHENAQMKEISDYFRIEMPTATSLLNKLVALKLVKRQTNKNDRRSVQVVLTLKGQEIVTQAKEKRHEKLSQMLSLLSLQEKEKLLEILKTITTNVERKYEK